MPKTVATSSSNRTTARPSTEPPWRTLRAFAHDPSLATQLENYDVSEVLVRVRWEPEWTVKWNGKKEPCFGPGPVGEYLEVVDVDRGSNARTSSRAPN
jgi:hypothetical protein